MQDELRGANTHDDAYTLFKSTATSRKESTTQVNAMCKNLKMGTVMGKTHACAISTVAWFFGEKRVPQTATRVEQVSEWITMWRGSMSTQGAEFRKVWRKKAPILAKDPRRWNQAADPISATICSVLEAGWKPSTPEGSANANMEKSGWAFAQCWYGERYHHRFCQEGQVSADQKREISWPHVR